MHPLPVRQVYFNPTPDFNNETQTRSRQTLKYDHLLLALPYPPLYIEPPVLVETE